MLTDKKVPENTKAEIHALMPRVSQLFTLCMGNKPLIIIIIVIIVIIIIFSFNVQFDIPQNVYK